MNHRAIVLEKVTKQYFLERPRTFKKWFKNLIHPFRKFTVIKDFSLIVKRGELLLIEGSNGSGKTTLLRLIAGVTSPDKGKVVTYGKVVPLIELGAGFNFELSGRENIFINSTILGIEKSKIESLIPKIVQFSGLSEFIDTPIKRYSTGMVSRLAFSIGIYSEPDILLLDEIFSVGDENFRKKSLEVLRSFRRQNVTIVVTSHSRGGLGTKPDRKLTLSNINFG